jgi:hypothetical protein
VEVVDSAVGQYCDKMGGRDCIAERVFLFEKIVIYILMGPVSLFHPLFIEQFCIFFLFEQFWPEDSDDRFYGTPFR